MKFEGFLHLNIRCALEDLPAIERFYSEVLELRSGYRPAFNFAGLWLYAGDDPVIHVSARYPKGSIVQTHHNGSVDHIAWKASGAVAFRKRMKELGVEFQEQNIEGAGYQVFLHDPVGTKLEFNFLDEHVEDAVPTGSVAKSMTMPTTIK